MFYANHNKPCRKDRNSFYDLPGCNVSCKYRNKKTITTVKTCSVCGSKYKHIEGCTSCEISEKYIAWRDEILKRADAEFKSLEWSNLRLAYKKHRLIVSEYYQGKCPFVEPPVRTGR